MPSQMLLDNHDAELQADPRSPATRENRLMLPPRVEDLKPTLKRMENL